MKKFAFTSSILFCLLLFTQMRCFEGFVTDPIDPRLPLRTQEGKGTVGAYIGEKAWSNKRDYDWSDIINDQIIKISEKHDSMVLCFQGRIDSDTVRLEISLSGLGIKTMEDLQQLENKKIRIDGLKNKVRYIRTNSVLFSKNDDIGQIWFSYIKVIKDYNECILSGTFGFTVDDVISLVEITDGRFDIACDQEIGTFVKID